MNVSLSPSNDWDGIVKSIAGEQGWKDKPGTILERSLAHLAKNIDDVAKDDMVREAIVGAWTTGFVEYHCFVTLPEHKSVFGGFVEKFEDGVLHIYAEKGPLTAENHVGRNLTKWL